MSAEALLEMKGIAKGFPGVQALKGVDFCVRKGEILCLLGENGAGKSTLMKILAGVQQPDTGTIRFDGRDLRLSSTREAAEQGISIVFQEFNLCSNLTAVENLFLGHEISGWGGLLSHRQMRERAREAFARLRMDIPLDALVKDLGVAQQQMIEVAKALSHRTRILIMDEPTSALADKEIDNLFNLMRELKGQGISIVFISHKLNEVLSITDRVVCLKDGANSGEIETATATEQKLVSMMVGRELDRLYSQRKGSPSSRVVLDVQNLSGPPMIRNVSFQVREGEIVGLAGLIGAGRTEVARLLMGADQKTAGTVQLDGRDVRIRHPADAVALGMGYASEDRKRLGLVLPMTVRENLTMSVHDRIQNRFGLISPAKEAEVTSHYIDRLRIKVSTPEQVVRNLSGGNQQKVVLGKWLAIRPKLLILDEPTRGIDVGAKAEVHKIIAELADAGVAILMISSELPEVLHVSDRILVLHEGRLTANLTRQEASEETIMRAAVG
jgi:ABC-type sugar transport system ATPase subunit